MVSEFERSLKLERRPRRALALGCGGTLGAAWSVVMLAEVSRALAWDPRTADVILGTSAGSTLAMLLGAGVSARELLDAQLGRGDLNRPLATYFAAPPPMLPPLPRAWRPTVSGVGRLLRMPVLPTLSGLAPEGRGDTRFLDALVEAHAPRGGWVAHPGVRIVAMDLETGRRVAFGEPQSPPASMREAVRASWAIPGWFPSVTIGARRYVDGGVVSPASVDLAAPRGVDEIVVLAPMSSTAQGRRRGLGRAEGVMRTLMRRTLDAEIEAVRARGVRVLRLEPTPEDLEVLGANLMDGRRRLAVIEHTLRSARRNVRASLEVAGFSRTETGNEGANAWQA